MLVRVFDNIYAQVKLNPDTPIREIIHACLKQFVRDRELKVVTLLNQGNMTLMNCGDYNDVAIFPVECTAVYYFDLDGCEVCLLVGLWCNGPVELKCTYKEIQTENCKGSLYFNPQFV